MRHYTGKEPCAGYAMTLVLPFHIAKAFLLFFNQLGGYTNAIRDKAQGDGQNALLGLARGELKISDE